jgi:hypothetical protein
MNLILGGLRGRFRLIALLGIALTVVLPRLTLAQQATFVNKTKALLYVRAFSGFATDKCTGPIIKELSLNPTAQDKITIGSNAFCYAASKSNDPNIAPVYCGIGINAPITVTFDDSTPPCRPLVSATQKQQQVKITLRGTAKPLLAAGSRGGGGVVYLDDSVHLQATLANWIDPLTPPHTEARCTKLATGDWPWGGSWSFCVGWEVDCQWMQNDLELVVTSALTTSYDALKQAVDDCLHDAVIVGAISGVIAAVGTGGGGLAVAQQTFQDVFVACLAAKIGAGELLSVSLTIHSDWSSWRPCVAP